jgi:hypothetical protein
MIETLGKRHHRGARRGDGRRARGPALGLHDLDERDEGFVGLRQRRLRPRAGGDGQPRGRAAGNEDDGDEYRQECREQTGLAGRDDLHASPRVWGGRREAPTIPC